MKSLKPLSQWQLSATSVSSLLGYQSNSPGVSMLLNSFTSKLLDRIQKRNKNTVSPASTQEQ